MVSHSHRMDFDPLSLFTPIVREIPTESTSNTFISKDTVEETLVEVVDEDHLIPLHILDFPLLQLKPPYEVLLVILKLISLNEVWNFQQEEEDREDPLVVFQDKKIPIETVHSSIEWFKSYCPRFDSVLKLSCVPKLAFALKKTNDYNDYLTRIISSDLGWMNEEQIAVIHKETSLRISENCGRTAQPELIRKIKLHNMDKLGKEYIKLKEPALTSDNLGLKTWGSSLILSQRLINDHQLKEPILELGSGTGLIGIILSCLKFEVYLTDLPDIVPNLKENMAINECTGIIDELDWKDCEPFLTKYHVNFNTIILSDPIYSPDHPQLIFDVLNRLCNPNTEILIQIPLRRNYEDIRSKLWDLLNKKYRQVYNNIERGSDEFGDTTYCFKKFIPL